MICGRYQPPTCPGERRTYEEDGGEKEEGGHDDGKQEEPCFSTLCAKSEATLAGVLRHAARGMDGQRASMHG